MTGWTVHCIRAGCTFTVADSAKAVVEAAYAGHTKTTGHTDHVYTANR